MNESTFTQYAKAVADAVQQRIEHHVAPLLARLAQLEATQPVPGERGEKGEQGEPGPQGERGADGVTPAPEDLEPLVQKVFAVHAPLLKGEQGERGPQGEPGADADVAALERTLRELIDAKFTALDAAIQKRVEDAAAAIEVVVPTPKDGIDGKDGLPGAAGRDGQDGQDGQDGRDGKDGRDGRDALDLVLLNGIAADRSYSRGTWVQHRGGVFVADRDTDLLGEAALHEPDALRMSGWRCVVRGVVALDFAYDGERAFTVRAALTDSKQEQQFKLPVVLDRGVWDEQRAYDCGDAVTCEGAMWIAQAPSSKARPGTADAWRLAVKRGRDGRDATTKDARNGPVSLR